jgi:GT2 family glycosyltransferase
LQQVAIANPVILSTAVVSREALLRSGGFREGAWLRGIEDYALWLKLADAGFEFDVLPEALAVYDDHTGDRLSNAPARREAAVTVLFLRRWLGDPLDREAMSAAAHHAVVAGNVARDAIRNRRNTRT